MPTYTYEKDGEQFEVTAKSPEEADAKFAQTPTQADTTPFKYKPRLQYNSALQDVRDLTSEKDKAAAASGVNIDSKLDTTTSALASLAANDAEKNAYITKALQDKYPGQEVQTHMGPVSGKLEYLDPKTKRWTEANENTAGIAGPLMETIPSTLGSMAGMALGAPGGWAGVLAGGATGAGLGQGLGYAAKVNLGKAFGLNESQPADAIAADATSAGLWAAGTDAAMAGIYGLGRGAKTWLFGKQVLSPEEARSLINAQGRAQKLVDEINSKAGAGVSGEPLYNPTTAQIAARERGALGTKMLQKQAQIEGEADVGERLSVRQDASEKGLQFYFENETLPFRLGNVDTSYKGGSPLKQAVQDERFNARRQITNAADSAKDQAGQVMQGLPAQQNASAQGQTVRNAIAEKYAGLDQAETKAYGEYQIKAGFDPTSGKMGIDIPISAEVKQLQGQLKARLSRIPLAEMAKGLKQGLLPESGAINLGDLDETIKFLRSQLRTKSSERLSLGIDARTTAQLEGSLQKMRDDYLSQMHPDVADALSQAEKLTIQKNGTFNRGIIKNLLTPSGGEYKMTDAGVLDRIVKNNDFASATELADVLKSSPTAMNEARNYLWAQYRKTVSKDVEGLIPDYKKHKAFMDKYGDVVGAFFGPSERTTLDELGGFAATMRKSDRDLKLLDRAWKGQFKGKIENFDADELVDGVLTKKFNTKEVYDLRFIAERYAPEVKEHWRAGIAENLREKLFDGDYINKNGLDSLLKDSDMVEKLNIVFGPQYGRSLRMLQEATDMIRQVPRNVALPSKNTGWTDLARVLYAPPLSREGVIVSAGQRSRSRNEALKIYNALTSSEALASMANRAETTVGRIKTSVYAGQAFQGLRELMKDD